MADGRRNIAFSILMNELHSSLDTEEQFSAMSHYVTAESDLRGVENTQTVLNILSCWKHTTDVRNLGALQIQDRSPQSRAVASLNGNSRPWASASSSHFDFWSSNLSIALTIAHHLCTVLLPYTDLFSNVGFSSRFICEVVLLLRAVKWSKWT